MFIDEAYINGLLDKAKKASRNDIVEVLGKARRKIKLDHIDIAILLQAEEEDLTGEIFLIAGEIKRSIYGNRIVIFAPLYVSNHCVNNCSYCGYKRSNQFVRRKLTMEEIKEEVSVLIKLGHKRLALEAGEDPVNCGIDYILECIETIYNTADKNSGIRRLNVNIAATTIENYQNLKSANIGTYILFQETYHPAVYQAMHRKSLKGDYQYHLTAFDRAMEAGLDDVGGGVLFGLADPQFEVLALMLHNEYLEKRFGVGFHTISVPRLKKAAGMSLDLFPHLINDQIFKKLVAIIRIALPFTGMILSTRESPEIRNELINYGVSQISAGSRTGVGGYKEYDQGGDVEQFEVADQRSPLEVLKGLLQQGHLPSYCTACYRNGRTGDRFMSLAKTGQIQNVCHPNAILTFMEFIMDYGDAELRRDGMDYLAREVEKIEHEDLKTLIRKNLEKLKQGERDLYI